MIYVEMTQSARKAFFQLLKGAVLIVKIELIKLINMIIIYHHVATYSKSYRLPHQALLDHNNLCLRQLLRRRL